MIYLSPKSDLVFKKLFGDVSHKHIVISFLKSVLERREGDLIVGCALHRSERQPVYN